MKRKILVLIGTFIMALNIAIAQNARLQIIHNSADLAAESVDVFVNGGIFLEDFKFRTATPFVDVPGGVDLLIDIAPTGAGIENSVGTFGANLVPGETYIAIASGIVSDAGYDPIYFFDLYPYFNAREMASSMVNTDVLVFHGSTDAPEVSVWEIGVGAGELFTFSYPNYEGYLELPTADYILEIRADGEPVAAYYAPLATAGLFGQAITVVASGFLNPANNSDGPAFGLFVALAAGGDLIELPVVEEDPFARVQIIHNSADLAAGSVDIFVNGALFLEDFRFRTATPFVDVPAGIDLEIDIAPSGAGIANSVGTFIANFDAGQTYVIVANGIVSAAGYAPAIDFDLYPYIGGREMASNMSNTDVLVFHGATDAPEVSVWEVGVGAGELFTFGYGEYQGYLELPTDDYVLEIRAGGEAVASYFAPLASAELFGEAITVVASGFLNPGENSDGPGFGLFVALAIGGDLIELPVYEEEKSARVQIIHNSADLAADSVDIFLNGFMLLPNFKFRTATPFVTVPADIDLVIDIAPAGAGFENSVATYVANFKAKETYVIIANGIVSEDGYEPAIDFDIYEYAGAREMADTTKFEDNIMNTDILAFHGSTDVPQVNVWVIGEETSNNFIFGYGDFAGYLELPTEDYVIEIRAGGETVVSYSAPLKSFNLEGEAITVLASGFLNPDNNSDGPGFGLFVALSTGGELIELPVYEEKTARIQIIHNSADLAAESVDVFVNGDILLPGFKFRTATPFVTVPAEVELTIDIAPAGAGIENSVATFDITLAADETYIAIANGIVSGVGYEPAISFDLYPFAGARENADSSANTDVLVFHGSTDAPEVSVWEIGAGAGELFTFAYGEYAGYLELPNEDYVLEIRAGGQPVVAYSAPLKSFSLDGEAITVVASGFLNPANNSDGPGFGLFVALSTGGELIELPVYEEKTARIQIIHNSADLAAESVDVFVNGDILLPGFKFRTATPFVTVPAEVELTIDIAPAGAGIENSVGTFDFTLAADETYIAIANGIVSADGYEPSIAFDIYPYAGAREAAMGSSKTDVLVFHGSTDAPEVTVWETGVGAGELFTFGYGEYAGYLELPTEDYVIEIRAGGDPVVAYSAPLKTLNLDGQALTVVASGFLNPANNSDGPGFGLFVALPSGGQLIALETFTSSISNIVLDYKLIVYPNPVTEKLFIEADIEKQADISISIYNTLGNKIADIYNERNVIGTRSVSYDISSLNTGVYFVTIANGEGIQARKIQVIK